MEVDKLGYNCEIYHNDFKPILINYRDFYSVEYHKKYMIYRIAITPANSKRLAIEWMICFITTLLIGLYLSPS